MLSSFNSLYSQATKVPSNVIRLAELSSFLLQIVKSHCQENNIAFIEANMTYELYKTAKKDYLQRKNLLINYTETFTDGIGIKNSTVVNSSNVEVIIEQRRSHPTVRIAAINLANADHPLGACLNGKPGSQEEYYGYNSSLLFDILEVLTQNNYSTLADTFIKTFFKHVVAANGDFIPSCEVNVTQWVNEFTELKSECEKDKKYNLFENISIYHEDVIFFTERMGREYRIPEFVSAHEYIVIADIISVAALNLAWWRIFSPSSNLINKTEIVREITSKKLASVSQHLNEKKVGIYIGGALGSGAFENDPYEVAKISYDQLHETNVKIIFAILITNQENKKQLDSLCAYQLEAKKRKYVGSEPIKGITVSIKEGDIFSEPFNFPQGQQLKTACIIGINTELKFSEYSNSVFDRIASLDQLFADELKRLEPTEYAQKYLSGPNPAPDVKVGYQDAILLPQTKSIAVDYLIGICSRDVTKKSKLITLFSATKAATHKPEAARENLMMAYFKALQLADKNEVMHVTTTLVGTGQHGIPTEVALSALFDAIEKFELSRDRNSEFSIRVMPFSKNSEELHAVKQCEAIQKPLMALNSSR